jgi:cell division protein FtsB
VWVPAIVVLAVVAAALDDERGIRTWFRLQGDLAAAELRIAALSQDIETHKALVEALTSDPFAIERAIREELWYAREGETLVRLRRPGLATPRND